MLLPNDWIENSIETYLYQHTTKSQKIYWVVLAAVILAFVSLPFIYVDVSVQGNGITCLYESCPADLKQDMKNKDLYVEAYITPHHIGYIYIGMPVNVQVKSFNYNEWGAINGTVQDISSDFLADSQGNCFFKIKCSMEKNHLTLKNGRLGRLKQGMNVSTHFKVARKSLFNLLYQKMDDWMNPAQNEQLIIAENNR